MFIILFLSQGGANARGGQCKRDMTYKCESSCRSADYGPCQPTAQTRPSKQNGPSAWSATHLIVSAPKAPKGCITFSAEGAGKKKEIIPILFNGFGALSHRNAKKYV